MNEVFSAALIGGLIGTFFGGFSKFLWERWLPDWLTWRRTQRVEREHELSNIRAPVFSALADLQARLRIVAETKAANARYTEAIGESDYYLHSTVYLLARAFAAQHLLRARMAGFDYADLYSKLERLTSALSHGGPGFQFFRLEQREIAERVLGGPDSETFSPMMLSTFLDQMEGADRPRWMSTMCRRVESLLSNPVEELDRLQSIDGALTEVLSLVDDRGRWQTVDGPPPIDAKRIRRSQTGSDRM